ncbi:Aminomethyltransferase folate-binding domain-containing protein [Myriangium duriaei CBS 260.36]|uniref:Iron-sulfur cluster assembly factor IBA57 homolog, mitochondrial n=1 Tax=Myriangium duriaei CBS 260.36 TaxID=1168546 RepID=A0A9P4J861_9PEZI|nr:Aminomethyltransferase folate-binding domain-containing protein [Myriangium duriaei CBS 260.36]
MPPLFRSSGQPLPLARYICARCSLRLNAARQASRPFSSTRPSHSVPAKPPASGYASLQSRSLISITGNDSPKFLHGLVTSSVTTPTPSTPGFYTAFLTAQGKVLHDVFVYPIPSTTDTGEGFILELDSTNAADLLKHLKRHKLRSKVALRALDEGEWTPYALWRPDDRWTPHGLGGGETPPSLTGVLQLVDARAPGLGRRVLVASGADTACLFDGLESATPDQYRIRRYVRGVPEGQTEIPRDGSFPMNVNLDTMGAVDFRKGCYVGQELTIRTHHTGVVRRRILPVALYDTSTSPPEALKYDAAWNGALPGAEAEIKVDGKRGKPGKWIAGVGNVGLAMVRLEMMTDLTVTNEATAFDAQDKFVVGSEEGTQLGVKAFVPDWLRGKVRAPKVQKRVE